MTDTAAAIRRLTERDAAEFWALRLRALRDHPEAFGRSYEESVRLSGAAVVARFRDDWTEPHGVMLGAIAGGALVGTAGLRRHDPEPQRHKAKVGHVYVVPEHRGRGTARALLAAVVAEAAATPGLEQVQLTVGTESQAARRLYVALGFEPFGVERRALKHGGRYSDEEHMVLFLRRVGNVEGERPAEVRD